MEDSKFFFLRRSKHIRWLALALILACGIIWFNVPTFELGPYGDGFKVTASEFIGVADRLDDFLEESSMFGELFLPDSSLLKGLFSKTPVYKVDLIIIIGLAICAILVLFKLNIIAWFLSLAIELSMVYLLLKIYESDVFFLVKGFWEIMGLNVLTIISLGNYSRVVRPSSGRA